MANARCSQCGKPAIALVANNPLCVDCTAKWQQVVNAQLNHQASLLNVMLGFAELHTGFRLPRAQISASPERAPLTLNNIHVESSVVGSINTGEVEKLDVMMTHIRAVGDSKLADALQEFTQAIINSKELSDLDKNSALEHLSFLASQSALPKEQRQTAVAKAVIPALGRIIATAGGLASLWSAFEPLLEGLF